ncbi:MAG: hypothetical protein HZA50_02430 [Planctomycetes bacterium]|nr:hypothetical protein [Planctomycetota bacterium]
MTVKLMPSQLAVSPGGEFYVAVEIGIEDGWVYYSPNPGGQPGSEPQPAGIDFSGDDLKLQEILWPPDAPHANGIGDVNNVYTGRIVVYLKVSVPADARQGQKKFVVAPTGQICKNVCVPVRDVLASGQIEVAAAAQPNPAWKDFTAGLEKSLPAEQMPSGKAGPLGDGRFAAIPPRPELTFWAAMGLAILAGLTLNIMPCVLPVIPLRIYSIIRMAGESPRRYVTLGMAFAIGVFAFFASLAAVNVGLKLALSRSFNWADHFQLVGVRVGLVMVVVAVAANLFGSFTIVVPSRIANLESSGRPRQGHLTTFGMGLMMAILATPCSFAILTTVMVWSQGQALWLGSMALCVIGIGMALPHVLIAAFPKMLKWLPRPGRWMELFRQSMGFVMLLVAVWLIGTFIENAYAIWVTAYAVVLALCLWIWGSWTDLTMSLARRIAVKSLAAAVAIGCGIWMLQPGGEELVKFEKFDESRIVTANGQGKVVLVKFTAAWCTECRVVEKLIYEDTQVAAELKRRGIFIMKGDATDRDMPAARWLDDRGQAVPLTVIFAPAGGKTAYLTGRFSRQELFDALDRATPPGK